MTRVGIITGVRREADCLNHLPDKSNLVICIAGADPFRAGNLAAHVLTNGADGVISFGLCGALDPALEAGDLILANRVISSEGKAIACDPDWTGAIAERLGDQVTRADITLAFSSSIVTDPKRKRVLRANTGADAVDMESFAVGLAAKRGGKSFAVIRAVSDVASAKLPEWTDEMVNSAGGTDGLTLLKKLAAHPGDLGKLIALGRGGTRALGALRQAAESLGPDFALTLGK
ncbi:MAG: hypothetical protein VW268_02155 [Rhodospirillaceae bacterium]